MKKTFSIEDILRPKALKLHPGFVTNTSPSTCGIQGITAGCHDIKDKQYALSIDYHCNQGAIHSRAGQIPGLSEPGQYNFTSVIREHIHRQSGEASVHKRDSTFHSYSPYRHESNERNNDRNNDRFGWDENTSLGREAVSYQGSHQEVGWHQKQGSLESNSRDRESQDRESQESQEQGRSCQASPVVSASSPRSASPIGKQESSSTPPSNQHLTTENHARSQIEADYLGPNTMPHPTYPAPHHIQPQPLPVCLPLPQVCIHTQFKTNNLT